jgi:hypothetical protein
LTDGIAKTDILHPRAFQQVRVLTPWLIEQSHAFFRRRYYTVVDLMLVPLEHDAFLFVYPLRAEQQHPSRMDDAVVFNWRGFGTTIY